MTTAASKKNVRPILLSGLLLALSLTLTFLLFQGITPSPLISTNILLLTLMNVNITLVVILVILLSRNVITFFFEKREKGLGFRRKLIGAFIGLSLIPCILLFVVASGLLTSSIENGLSIQVERSLDASLRVAQTYYDEAQKTTERLVRQVGQELVSRRFFENRREKLSAYLHAKQKEYDANTSADRAGPAGRVAPAPLARSEDRAGLVALHLLTPEGTIILSTGPENEWVSGKMFPFSFDLSKKVLTPNQPITTITSGPRGDLIRVIGSLNNGILAADWLIPASLVGQMEIIKRESEEYKQLKAFKTPIKASYLLSFSIVVLLIVFSATWFGVYLARGITVPIQKLAEGTTAVAHGDLDFQIALTAKDELGVLVTSFNKMTRDLKQSREALVRAQRVATWQEVALQMAHEIKNPLTPIQLSTERLRRKYFEHAPDIEQIFDESTQIVIQEVQRLTALVNEFSNFARLPSLRLLSQSLEPILREVVSLYQSGYKGIDFHLSVDEALPSLQLDRDQMKRVFVNLLENAVEASPSRETETGLPLGHIFISATHDIPARKVVVTVEDEGHGIASEDVDKIFLPHFSRKKRGTGLGLAMVHRIILDHGGRIGASPRLPRGTTLRLELPV